MKNTNNLNQYAYNVFSQKGEDGILQHVFETIGSNNKWCVEFGAWDGTHYSNTYNLMKNKAWSGVFIESDPNRFQELRKTYSGNERAICINAFVNFDGPGRLDMILKDTPIPKQFDLLSIDIDGNDYHIWESVRNFSPRVVVIEFNPTIPADISFIQPKDMRVTQGSSLKAITELGKQKGYELVAVTYLNAIFVKNELFSRFGITENFPETFKQTDSESRLFQLYDGTIVLQGRDRLLWHDIKIRPKDIQAIPRIFRKHPDNLGYILSKLFKIWRKFHNMLS